MEIHLCITSNSNDCTNSFYSFYTTHSPARCNGPKRETTNIITQNAFRSYHVLIGGLSLAIEGPSKADISCVDNQDGTCTVSYLPVLPGDYSILVRYNDKHIPGSPFSARITGNIIYSQVLQYELEV